MLLIPGSITLQPTRATENADAKVPTETGTGDTTTITFIWTLKQHQPYSRRDPVT